MHYIYIIIATILWASTYSINKVASYSIHPADFVSLRLMVTSIFFILILPWNYKKISLRSLKAGVVLGGIPYITLLAQGYGAKNISSSLASFIIGCCVVFIFFFKILIFRYKPSFKELVSVFFAVVGLMFVTHSLTGDGNGTVLGFSQLLASSALAGLHIIFTDKFVKTIDSLILVMVQVFFSTILCLWRVPVLIKISPEFDLSIWKMVLFAGFFCSFLAWLLLTEAQKYLSDKQSGIILMLEPIFGSIISFFLVGERGIFSISFVLGTVIVLSSIFYLSVQSQKETR